MLTDTINAARLLVTGSREFSNPQYQWHIMDAARGRLGHYLTVVWGNNSRGSDKYTEHWCAIHRANGVTPEPHDATWSVLGRRAGPDRNAEMVESGANHCLAFLERGAQNRGTRDCAIRAARAGVSVEVHWSDGPDPICNCDHAQIFHVRRTTMTCDHPTTGCIICTCIHFDQAGVTATWCPHPERST